MQYLKCLVSSLCSHPPLPHLCMLASTSPLRYTPFIGSRQSQVQKKEEYGYIRLTARASGFWQFALTVEGIKFAENGYKEPEPAPLFKGDNSIFINGSQNTVSNNYNEISVDVSSSDLPDDCKKLIEDLLYELKNPYITPEKKSNVINKFLTDISSGAISGTAATGLTFLLKSLFSHIGL